MNELDKLKDVKTIVSIEAFNPVWILVVLAIILAVVLTIFIIKKRPKRYKFKKSTKELAKERINSIDFSDPKSVAYTFAKDVALFVDESNLQEYNQIEKELEAYKYKKDVPALNSSLESRIKEFIKGIKWTV